MKITTTQQQWFDRELDRLQNAITAMLVQIEEESAQELYQNYEDIIVNTHTWKRTPEAHESGISQAGGGLYKTVKGKVWEKATANVSKIEGRFSENMMSYVPNSRESNGFFSAQGLSCVIHPRNPFLPAIHMNIRCMTTSKSWFGGCLDLNPMTPLDQSHQDRFHHGLKKVCDHHVPGSYQEMAKDCDTYFMIKHRQRPRGIGGIFFDKLMSQPDPSPFMSALGDYLISYYRDLSRMLMNQPWGKKEKEEQEQNRGYYAEFNLVYDKGTRFGFGTSGNTDAILMSLPPSAKWPLRA